jgi:hypothetical protein
VVLAVVACKVSTNLDQVIALEVSLPDSGRVEVTDTLHPSARALNGHGDSVAADIVWVSLDTAIIVVLDSATGATRGDSVATGRLQASVGLLHSLPLNVTVLAHLDSARAFGSTRDTFTVSLGDTLSDSLRLQLFATPTPASSRRVVFSATLFPANGPMITFVPNDTILSNGSGVAATRLKLVPGSALPESVWVTTSVKRPDGTPIDSSVTFVVEFRP